MAPLASFFLLLPLLAPFHPSLALRRELQAPAPQSNTTDAPPSQENWSWCVDNAKDLSICNAMVKILDAVDEDPDHTHSCVQGKGDDDCMQRIKDGTNLFAVFDGGEIWEAYNEYQLVPIRTEYSEVDNARYFGVGIVNADKCPNSFSDLKGLRSCHTGYGRASGWLLPISYLMKEKYMPIVAATDSSKPIDTQSVEAFFSKSCAAYDEPEKEICTCCKTTTNCDEDDLYYDYAGSFRCLVEGSGDISFTKGVIPGQYAKGGTLQESDWTDLKDASQYKILCPQNAEGNLCADVTSYRTCNFGSAPGHTIMASKNLVKNEVDEFNEVMSAANSNAAYIQLFSANNYSDSEFASGVARSVAYNKSVQDLLGSLYDNILYMDEVNAGTQKSTDSSDAISKLAVPTERLITAALGVVALVLML